MRRLNLKDDSGQTMILTLLCMTVLLAFVGLAADIGLMFRAKRNMQIAADSAAVAGAAELNYGDWSTAAQAAATQDGLTNGTNGALVAINSPPQYGAFAGLTGYVEAIVSQPQPTFFARVLNLDTMGVSARAVGTLGPAEGCIYTLEPGGTDFTLNDTVTISAPGCSILDDSTSDPSGLVANGSGTVTARSIGVVGGYTSNGAGQLNPTPVTGIVPVSDPLAYLPAPAYAVGSCVADPAITSGTASQYGDGNAFTVPPGCYNGFTITGTVTTTVTLSGVYIINGALTINGTPTITGTGVTLYFPPGASSVYNGTPNLNLSAPTTGIYNGVLIYQDAANTQSLIVNGAGTSTLEGIVYAPSANVTIDTSPTTTFYAAIVAGSLTLDGSGTLQDYSVINGASDLTAARLVE